jgi:D-alanine--poly(phosphoribitol) ligase subunit 2
MMLEYDLIVNAVKLKVMEISRSLDCDASGVEDDELLPATGLIDSSGLLELITWFENFFDLSIPMEDFTIDNLGSMERMSHYLIRRKSTP